MYSFGKGFGKAPAYNNDWRSSYKNGKGFVPWNGGTSGYGGKGYQGNSDVKELTSMFKYQMEKEWWKEEKKECEIC